MTRISLAILVLVLSACSTSGPKQSRISSSVTEEVGRLLDQQIADWNRGDIDAFMRGYWRSEELRFASGGNLKRGWTTVMNDYERRYPNRAAMGRLQTVDRQITEIDSEAALVFGRWVVSVDDTAFCGLFTLLVRVVDGRWVVVHDHTSIADGPLADGRTCGDIAG